MSYNWFIQALVIGFGLVYAAATYGAEFIPLPQLPGSTQAGDAFGVSADGSTVVGTSHDGLLFRAVKWTSSGEIGVLQDREFSFSFAFGVSADGSTIAGYRRAYFDGVTEAVRWTGNSGAMPIGDLPGGEPSSHAYDVSSDGAVIVGSSSSTDGGEAFRWTATTGIVGLGDLPGGGFGSDADGTSADGSVIIGQSRSESGREAYRWTADGGMVGLGDLPDGGFFSDANGISADGSVVVGRSSASFLPVNMRAFRWTAESGMVALPDVPGIGPAVIAEAISGDGNVIVGASNPIGDEGGALVWDRFHGSRDLNSLLIDQGVDLRGFDLTIVRGISHDGLTMAGLGVNPEGLQQPWVARLDPGTFIPEPSSFVLGAIALFSALAITWRRRRFSRVRESPLL